MKYNLRTFFILFDKTAANPHYLPVYMKVNYLFNICVYHILVDNIAKVLPFDKILSFVQNNKRNHVYFTQFHKNGTSGLIKQVY